MASALNLKESYVILRPSTIMIYIVPSACPAYFRVYIPIIGIALESSSP